MAANALHHRTCYPTQDQLSSSQQQSSSCDLFHVLDADLRSSEFGAHQQQGYHQHDGAQHVYQQHDNPHEDEGCRMLPPMSSFSQSFPSPGDYHPKYHSFNESPDAATTAAIDFNQILNMGCDSDHEKQHQHQQQHHQQEYIQSFGPGLPYPHFGSGGEQDTFMSGPEVTFDSSSNAMSHEYLTTDSHAVSSSSSNSLYGPDGTYVLLSASDYAASHSVHTVSHMDTSHKSHEVDSHQTHASGYPFQSQDSQVPHHQPHPATGTSATGTSTRPRSAFSHTFPSTDFFVSFVVDDGETSESLIDLQSTLDLLPPTPQPVAHLITGEQDPVAPHHKSFAPHSFHSSSDQFAFATDQQPASRTLLPAEPPADDFVQKVECFKCKLCDFLCLDRSGVLMHISDKHHENRSVDSLQFGGTCPTGKTLFPCSSCRKSFTSQDECSKHMEAEHQIPTTSSQGLGHESCATTTSASSKSNADPAALSPVPEAAPQSSIPSNSSAFTLEKHPLVQQQPNSPAIDDPGNKLSEQKNDISSEKSSQAKGGNSKKMAWQAKLVREQGSYICSKKKCSVRYLSMENMVRHEKCHMDDGSGFGCSECDKFKSENWSSCAGHLWREHAIDMELHKCGQCSYRSYSLSVLENIHKKIHSSEKNYVCSICQKGFKNQKQLVNHKVRHDKRPGDKALVSAENKSPPKKVAKECSHECELCGKAFPETRPLRVHMDMVHKKKRPYLCLQCGHSAASKGALRVHIRSHTGEKPFKCEECEYSTSDHNSLRRHKMRHSGERPYKCPFCAYACIQVSCQQQCRRPQILILITCSRRRTSSICVTSIRTKAKA